MPRHITWVSGHISDILSVYRALGSSADSCTWSHLHMHQAYHDGVDLVLISVAYGSGRVLLKPTRPGTRPTPVPKTPGARYPTSPGDGLVVFSRQQLVSLVSSVSLVSPASPVFSRVAHFTCVARVDRFTRVARVDRLACVAHVAPVTRIAHVALLVRFVFWCPSSGEREREKREKRKRKEKEKEREEKEKEREEEEREEKEREEKERGRERGVKRKKSEEEKGVWEKVKYRDAE
ncbi:hypothetical protein FB446DRAFT_832544 [Lentinula raphanica]|nr:hypothetical protein FB446DRAFT_832544 [Lentinula raphanica]